MSWRKPGSYWIHCFALTTRNGSCVSYWIRRISSNWDHFSEIPISRALNLSSLPSTRPKVVPSPHLNTATLPSISRTLRFCEPNFVSLAGSKIGIHCMSFYVTAPNFWSALPHGIRSISDVNSSKRRLKTHLFLYFVIFLFFKIRVIYFIWYCVI